MERPRLSYLTIALLLVGLSALPDRSLALGSDSVVAIRRPHGFDQQLFWNINHSSFADPGMDGFMKVASGSLMPVAIAVPLTMIVGGLAMPRNQDAWVTASNGLTIAAGTVITLGLQEYVIKPLVRRDRPYKTLDSVRWIDSSATGYSFPSSHAAASWGLAVGLSLRYPKWYVIVPTTCYALVVTFSRPYLGVHFPTDVLAGALVGSLVQFGIYRLQYSVHTVRGSGGYFATAVARQPFGLALSLPLAN